MQIYLVAVFALPDVPLITSVKKRKKERKGERETKKGREAGKDERRGRRDRRQKIIRIINQYAARARRCE